MDDDSNKMSRPYIKAKMLANFKESPTSDVVEGVQILHRAFGFGEILSTTGEGDKKIAKILFEDEIGEKRILLKVSKVQVIK